MPFLGSVELVPEIRQGGDTGLPVALGGETSKNGAEFFAIAKKLATRALEIAAVEKNILEIS